MASTVILISSSPTYAGQKVRMSTIPAVASKAPKSLKTGSRATAIPQGVAVGFRSANAVLEEADIQTESGGGNSPGVGIKGGNADENDESEKENLDRKSACEFKSLKERDDALTDSTTIINPIEDAPAASKTKTRVTNSKAVRCLNLEAEKKPAANRSRKKAGNDKIDEDEGGKTTQNQKNKSTTGDGKLKRVKKPKKDDAAPKVQSLIEGEHTKPGQLPKLKAFRKPGTIATSIDLGADTLRTHSPAPAVREDTSETAVPMTAIGTRSWTPCIDTIMGEVSTELSVKGDPVNNEAPGLMGNLQNSFGYVEKQPKDITHNLSRMETGESLAKRRRIEVIYGYHQMSYPTDTAVGNNWQPAKKTIANIPPLGAPPLPVISPALPSIQMELPAKRLRSLKKPVTITAQAIAKDRGVDPNQPAIVPGVISAYGFQADDTSKVCITKVALNDSGDEKPKKKRKTKARTAPDLPPPLPSPISAKMRIDRQEVLFGTASQIASHEDPSFIRDMQKAIQASGSEHAFTHVTGGPVRQSTIPSRRNVVSTTKRNLWAVGARGQEATTLTPEDPENRRLAREAIAQAESAIVIDDSFAEDNIVASPALSMTGTAKVHNARESGEDHTDLGTKEANLATEAPRVNGPPALDDEDSFVDINILKPMSPSAQESTISNDKASAALSTAQALRGGDLLSSKLARLATGNAHQGKATRKLQLSSTTLAKPSLFYARKKGQSAIELEGGSLHHLPPFRLPTTTTSSTALLPNILETEQTEPHTKTVAAMETRDSRGAPANPSKITAEAEADSEQKPKADRKRSQAKSTKADNCDMRTAETKSPKGKKSTDSDASKRGPGRPRKNPITNTTTKKASKRTLAKAAAYLESPDEIEDDAPPSPSPSRRAAPSAIAALDLTSDSPTTKPVVETVTKSEAKTTRKRKVKLEKAEKEEEGDEPKSKRQCKKAGDKSGKEQKNGTRADTDAKGGRKTRLTPDPVILEAVDNALEELYPRITAVIRGQPRGSNPQCPSWWERILLYDPIILEDITQWLNEQGLLMHAVLVEASMRNTKKMHDGVQPTKTLTPKVVQRWCEACSICAAWNESVWEKKRNRKLEKVQAKKQARDKKNQAGEQAHEAIEGEAE